MDFKYEKLTKNQNLSSNKITLIGFLKIPVRMDLGIQYGTGPEKCEISWELPKILYGNWKWPYFSFSKIFGKENIR